MRIRVLTLLIAGLLALPLTAEAQKPIKVGFPMILSGPGALFGELAEQPRQDVEKVNADIHRQAPRLLVASLPRSVIPGATAGNVCQADITARAIGFGTEPRFQLLYDRMQSKL